MRRGTYGAWDVNAERFATTSRQRLTNRATLLLSTFCVAVALLCFAQGALADTIYLKDGEKLKGLVVEEYYDRVLFSQEAGETEIMRTDIDEIFYDTQIQNYLYMGDAAFYEKDFEAALKFYQKAEQMNSADERARDAVYRTYDAISREGMGFDPGQIQAALLKQLGIIIKNTEGRIRIERENIFAAAFLSVGDYITGICGLATKYMDEDMAAEFMAGKPGTFIKLEVEKTIALASERENKVFAFLSGSNLGLRLTWKTEGLIVAYIKKDGPADRGGLKVGDVVAAINGESTRYMAMKKVNKRISRGHLQEYVFNVRRSLLIKRQEAN